MLMQWRVFIKLLIALFFVTALMATSHAGPIVDNITGTFSQGGSISMTGSGFGAKNPVKPLVLANFETSIQSNSTLSLTLCEEDTATSINRSGIETLPFMRMNFADVEGNGIEDMIAGNKNGFVYRYRNSGDPVVNPWRQIPGYFSGVKAGAFSSPALADFDGDGKMELIIGTGGFSSDSGKILFFRNEGSRTNPSWRLIPALTLSIGNDAAVTVVDYDFDGRPDIIACNSEGKIFFFRNVSSGHDLKFIRETNPLVKSNFGMYAVPAAKKIGNSVFLAVGNSMGKLFLFELKKNGIGVAARQIGVGLRTKTFASPVS